MILLIGGEKGGSGKSCLAQNIAVFLQQKGKEILLVDSDPQGTTTDWVKERNSNKNIPNILSVQMSGNIREEILALSAKYENIIIDAGGQDSEALRSSMTVATHMLLPFRPKRRDLKTLPAVEQLIKMAKTVNPKLITAAVITQCPTLPSQYQRILEAKESCQSFSLKALNAITSNRNIYDDADEEGLTVLESTTKDDKAINEITSIVNEFLGC